MKREKAADLIEVILGLIPFLLMLIPTIYTHFDSLFMPVNSYEMLTFLADNNSNEYNSAMCVVMLLILQSLIAIAGILSFLSKEKSARKSAFAFSNIFYIGAIATLIAFFYFTLKTESNIHLNLGAYVLLIYFVLSYSGFLFAKKMLRSDDIDKNS